MWISSIFNSSNANKWSSVVLRSLEDHPVRFLSEHQESMRHKEATEFLNYMKNQHTTESNMAKQVKKTIGRS